jgi:clorobiocin biosynthesis protein CloN6
LIHPPAYFNFREKIEDIYWPFFSSGGSEPITPLYENFPIGFLSLKNVLSENGFKVEIINVSSLILMNPEIDLEDYFSRFQPKLIGISLHWMVHVQGALAMSDFFKKVFPSTPVIFGGISSTYYANELITRQSVDMVMRGYDTHLPMLELMRKIKNGSHPHQVENLLWKQNGEVIDNAFEYLPKTASCGINLEYIPKGKGGFLDFKDILSVENYGCAHNCGWCGGSRDAFRRINNVKKGLVTKSIDAIEYELQSLEKKGLDPNKSYNLYSLGAYSESNKRLKEIFETVSKYPVKSLMVDQFHLTKDSLLKEMAAIDTNITINLSPQSHDIEVSKLSGRGTYTMEEMEEWIDKALDIGINSIDIYFFIGMPKQDANSIKETVNYCKELLTKFKGKKINAFICPMMPFLDPGCNYFEEPEKYGYTIYHRTLEEHNKAMENPSIVQRLNYETKWLTRKEIVTCSYEAIIELFTIKKELGLLSYHIVDAMVDKLQTALEMIDIVDTNNEVPDHLKDVISTLNRELFFGEGSHATVVNQAFPIKRKIGSRWFDVTP